MPRVSYLIKTAPLVTAILWLTACSELQQSFTTVEPAVAGPDPLTRRLANAADRAVVALETLAEVERTRTQLPPTPDFANAPPHLRQQVTVSWNGPIEPIAQRLAERAGYGFQAIGAPPVVPIVVTLDAVSQPIIEVFRNLGLQAALRAEIVVDSSRQLVELRYAPAVDR